MNFLCRESSETFQSFFAIKSDSLEAHSVVKITIPSRPISSHSLYTSHSAYVATSTELHGVKIDGCLYPSFM